MPCGHSKEPPHPLKGTPHTKLSSHIVYFTIDRLRQLLLGLSIHELECGSLAWTDTCPPEPVNGAYFRGSNWGYILMSSLNGENRLTSPENFHRTSFNKVDVTTLFRDIWLI